jgi:hypothetical protein
MAPAAAQAFIAQQGLRCAVVPTSPRLLAALALAFLAVPFAPSTMPASPLDAEVAVNFRLVGHEPLFNRGMNAAPALYRDEATDRTFVYVGSRTDGSPQHLRPGVQIVEVTDPADPEVVGEIGLPQQGLPSMTSRELRVWPQAKLLMVLSFGCSAILHACTSTADAIGSVLASNIKFYDLTNPLVPTLVSTYFPTRTPHEFFLWVDPGNAARALLFMSTPTSSSNAGTPNLVVADVSNARTGTFVERLRWNGNPFFTASDRNNFDVRLHSLGVSVDGKRAYLAYLSGGFLVLDTSRVANATVVNPTASLVTVVAKRAHWGDPGAHSAVKIPGKSYALVTDEVYGDLLDALGGGGCPWGWVRTIDIGLGASEADPEVAAEYKLPENRPEYCQSLDGQDASNTFFTSYSAHNPTVLGDIALVTWHGKGLQAIDLADPRAPAQAGLYMPTPLPAVVTEDPALSMGRSKVVMWSYPILFEGLVYVLDIRNGLYVLEYTGPHAANVAATRFLEGNSNLGDALLLPP